MSRLAASKSAGIGFALRSLKHRDFRLYVLGQTISVTGTWIHTIALNWLVFDLTGSALMLGIVNLVGGLVAVPFALWGGLVADRYSRRNILVITQATMLIVALCLAIIVSSDIIQIWHIFIIEICFAIAKSFDMPARQAFLIESVGSLDLASAVGMEKVVGNLSRMLGPSIAGILIAIVGTSGAFFTNSASFIVVIICLLLMRPVPRPPQSKTTKASASLVAGIKYVVDHDTARVLLVLIGLATFLAMPYLILLPVFASNVLSVDTSPTVQFICNYFPNCQSPEAIAFGFLMGASGLGSLVGSFVVAQTAGGEHQRKYFAISMIGLPLSLMAFAYSRSFLLSLLLLTISGFSWIVQSALTNTVLQLKIDDKFRGRVMSLYTIIVQGSVKFGGVQAGFIAEWFGASIAVFGGAIVTLFIAIAVLIKYPSIVD